MTPLLQLYYRLVDMIYHECCLDTSADTFIVVFELEKAHIMALEYSSGLQVLSKMN